MRAVPPSRPGLDQPLHLLAAARSRPEMAEPEHVRRPQHDHLELVGGGIGFEDQLLRRLERAVGARTAAREILRDRRVAFLAPAVVDAEGRDVDEPPHAGEPHRLRDVAGAAEIDVEAGAERLLHAVADQAGGVHDGVGAVLLDGRDQVGQVAHVVARQRIALVAELELEEVGARLRIDEHDLLAARDGVLGKGGADQPRAGDDCGHECSPSVAVQKFANPCG